MAKRKKATKKQTKGIESANGRRPRRTVPSLRQGDVIAILCSDIHLSHTAPPFRSEELDWYEAMRRPLDELGGLSHKYNCPILCAGDIFDRWNACPGLINFAMKYLPKMYSIPGQHDLPYHSVESIEKSAYYTLAYNENIHHVDDAGLLIDDLEITGFAYGERVVPHSSEYKEAIKIALIHEYLWVPGKSYPKAPVASKLTGKMKQFKGWDIVCIGDNHKGFKKKIGNTTFFNCGSLMRRKSDDIEHEPWIGLVTKDKEVIPHYLDVSKDRVYTTPAQSEGRSGTLNVGNLIDQLNELGKDSLDFRAAVKHYLHKHKISRTTRQLITEALQDAD